MGRLVGRVRHVDVPEGRGALSRVDDPNAVRSIVVGYDGSEASRRAIARGAILARDGAALNVVRAIPLRMNALGAVPPRPAEIQACEHDLDEAAADLTARGVASRRVCEWGNPADVIIDEIREVGADLVVVGSTGKNVVERHVLGSVSSELVHRAPCDVLIVR